ncbi:MAG: hypothetical protein EXX96DRAFT_591949 [Benjaminiella poitrasii]|nr:MAG: hypothetical protein EXX96DRAFT_591949 [Benjaminiella poitrasii]
MSSTFIFAPSWITYPNQSITIRKEPNTTIEQQQQQHTNAWSNSPSTLHKIQNEQKKEEKNYELERLKALVPKTKKSMVNNNNNNNNATTNNYKRRTINKITTKQKTTATVNGANKLTVNFVNTKEPQLEPQSQQQQYLTQKEQVQFMDFLKSWTSTGIISNNNNNNGNSASLFDSTYFYHIPFPTTNNTIS